VITWAALPPPAEYVLVRLDVRAICVAFTDCMFFISHFPVPVPVTWIMSISSPAENGPDAVLA
jgi:hypothetical protein